jgi:hypothetical protein
MDNKDVMKQIEALLKEVQEVDAVQHRLMVGLLAEVYVEFNTGKNGAVEQKLYKLIDLEVRKTTG